MTEYAAEQITSWDDDLESALAAPTGFWQNAGKKEILFRTYGRGASTLAEKFYEKTISFLFS